MWSENWLYLIWSEWSSLSDLSLCGPVNVIGREKSRYNRKGHMRRREYIKMGLKSWAGTESIGAADISHLIGVVNLIVKLSALISCHPQLVVVWLPRRNIFAVKVRVGGTFFLSRLSAWKSQMLAVSKPGFSVSIHDVIHSSRGARPSKGMLLHAGTCNSE